MKTNVTVLRRLMPKQLPVAHNDKTHEGWTNPGSSFSRLKLYVETEHGPLLYQLVFANLNRNGDRYDVKVKWFYSTSFSGLLTFWKKKKEILIFLIR